MASAEWRALVWVWAGIGGFGVTGAAALQVMGPPPVVPPAASHTTADALPISLPGASSGLSLWPALATPTRSPTPAATPTPTPTPAPVVAVRRRQPVPPVARGQVRITVIPPIPPGPAPDRRRAHPPGPRAYVKADPRPGHQAPLTPDVAAKYRYAAQEPADQAEYGPPSYGGWGWSGPRHGGNGSYGGGYSYYSPYRQ